MKKVNREDIESAMKKAYTRGNISEGSKNWWMLNRPSDFGIELLDSAAASTPVHPDKWRRLNDRQRDLLASLIPGPRSMAVGDGVSLSAMVKSGLHFAEKYRVGGRVQWKLTDEGRNLLSRVVDP